jgi:hypothetical protein
MAESNMIDAVERRLTRAEAATAAKKRAKSQKSEGDRYAGLGDFAKKMAKGALETAADVSTGGLYSGLKLGAKAADAIRNMESEPSGPAMSRAEAATAAKKRAEDYAIRKEMEDSLNMPPAPPRNRAEAATFMKERAAAPAAAPAPKATQATPPTQAAPSFDGEAVRDILLESEQVPSPETAPRSPEPQMREVGGEKRPPMELQMERQPMAEEAPPKAQPVVSEDRLSSLFKTSTGTPFNPKSKADAGRMEQLRSFVESNPDILNKSDTGVSLAFYRTLK